MIGVLLAAALLGAPPVPVLLVALAWVSPIPAGALVIALALFEGRRRRKAATGSEAELLDISSRLRAGRTLRETLGVNRLSPSGRLAISGRSMTQVVEARWGDDPQLGPLLGPALEIVSVHGGPAAPVFESAAGVMVDDAAVRREVRMASAGPVAQGLLVGGVPLVMLLTAVASGSLLEQVNQGGAPAAVAVAGAGFTLAGAFSTAWLIRKAIR